MFGLSTEQWQNVVLSVKTNRRSPRRLTPSQVGQHLQQALASSDLETLAHAIGFSDSTTVRKLIRLADLPSDVAPLIDWGSRTGTVSMSTAGELVRLPSQAERREAVKLAVTNRLTREEARQLAQLRERTGKPLTDCLTSVLHTRPVVERSELILGSFISEGARQSIESLGPEDASRRIRRALARRFPDVVVTALRISGSRFSLMLKSDAATRLRSLASPLSIEELVTSIIVEEP